MARVTRLDVEQFVNTLDLEYQRVYEWARSETFERDTGCHEFQLAARIDDVFGAQAQWLADLEKEGEDG